MLRISSRLITCLAVTIWFVTPHATFAVPTVWSGLSVDFTKPAFGNPTQPENQDRISDNVWLSRSVQQGIFNARSETGFVAGVSPADTEWATALMPANAGEVVAATNWPDLVFDDWIGAYGGQGTQMLPARLTTFNAVVHLITDDVYFDLQFTNWSISGGGSFSYQRATGTIPPPAPTGDYNQNGVVDAADYVVWRKTLNQSASPAGSGADGNESGAIDAGDYEFWRARFGNVVPGTTSGFNSATVPEPATAASSILWIAILVAQQFRRQRF
jgi:hypothetical protein